MSKDELKKLCDEIRAYLIKTVSKTGGHLASNLGTVELIVALHRVFSTPSDRIVFDVGHQSYTHKILTGRFGNFSSLRTKGGVSGFPRQKESIHDAFIGGHSGISVSAAFGIAEGLRLSTLLNAVDNNDGNDKNTPPKTIAVIGDGAFTDGGSYEGMNNAGKSKSNLLVILNDNEMSISKNTGAFALHLSHLRSSRRYYNAKKNVKSFLEKSRTGEVISEAVSSVKDLARGAIYRNTFFENLGFKYYGVVDGHNLTELIEVFENVKFINSPCLVHVKTKKGKGYKPAERNSGEYHGIPAKAAASPPPTQRVIDRKEDQSFSAVFGQEIASLAEKDDRIVLISAAMKYATGCNYFNDKFPERFYDCGIAEGHAVTFAAGIASLNQNRNDGKRIIPVFAVYSTFLQRGFDRLLHDCSIEKQHIVLAIDRAGVVGEDGETHQGVFDVAMLSIIPGFTVFSPATPDELKACLRRAIYEVDGPVAVRYPRGTPFKAKDKSKYNKMGLSVITAGNGNFKLFKIGSKQLVVTYGRIIDKIIHESDILQLIKIVPLPSESIRRALEYDEIVFCEEGVERGGIGEAFLLELVRWGFKGKYTVKAVKDFIPCASVESQLNDILFD